MNLLKKKYATITAVCCSLLFLGCSKHETELETITYSYEVSEDLKEMVDITILYNGKDRKPVSEKLVENKWEKTILVARPFYAEMQIQYVRKKAFLPRKEYYSFHRMMAVNESVSSEKNRISLRLLPDFIDDLCSNTHSIFYEFK